MKDIKMEEVEAERKRNKKEGDDSCSFVWDESTQLYYHSSSGFYHDPVAGWYYSSRDGQYYKFEDGNYVLLDPEVVNEHEQQQFDGNDYGNSIGDEMQKNTFYNVDEIPSSSCPNHNNSQEVGGAAHDESTSGYIDSSDMQAPKLPPPTSEWLEETLINLYLPGSRPENAVDNTAISLEMDENNDADELEEGEIREDVCASSEAGKEITDEDISREEENWRAQYGQVVQSDKLTPDMPTVDLWDWTMIKCDTDNGKGEVAKLVGRLLKQTAKLHPSMPSKVGLFRTAPVCEASLDLVRVRTGQVYKLHNPSARYLASLPYYDSSDPTKDWGFPELSNKMQKSRRRSKVAPNEVNCNSMSDIPMQHCITTKKQKNNIYRDRAVERRILHGGFGVGPGQKRPFDDDDDNSGSTSPTLISTEEAAAEARNMSFGTGSYARKLLEGMGWKEGKGLGSSSKGIVEPIEAVGNIGNAGLGWPQGRAKQQ